LGERPTESAVPRDGLRERIPTETGEEPPHAADERDDRNDLIRRMGAVLANVGVLTALLVYFGWKRSEVQSRRLGIDESILPAAQRPTGLTSAYRYRGGRIALAADGPLARRTPPLERAV
jgi:hypothetical protein